MQAAFSLLWSERSLSTTDSSLVSVWYFLLIWYVFTSISSAIREKSRWFLLFLICICYSSVMCNYSIHIEIEMNLIIKHIFVPERQWIRRRILVQVLFSIITDISRAFGRKDLLKFVVDVSNVHPMSPSSMYLSIERIGPSFFFCEEQRRSSIQLIS